MPYKSVKRGHACLRPYTHIEDQINLCVWGIWLVRSHVDSSLSQFVLILVNLYQVNFSVTRYSSIFSTVNTSSFGELLLILVNSFSFQSVRSHTKFDQFRRKSRREKQERNFSNKTEKKYSRWYAWTHVREKMPPRHLRTAKAMIKLRICAVWSGPSLSAYIVIEY